MISTTNLRFRRRSFELGPINLNIEPGELCCILGPNGCGKTTLLHLLLGRLEPGSGTSRVAGCDSLSDRRELLRRVGFTPDEPDLLVDELTAEEYWDMLLSLHRVSPDEFATARMAREEAIGALGLTTNGGLIAGFSHGMRKKTSLVAVLQRPSPVWILDEPRNGLDPFASRSLERIIHEARSEGTTVVVTTHDLAWAQRLGERIVMLFDGAVVDDTSVDDLVRRHGSVEDAFFAACDRREIPKDGTPPLTLAVVQDSLQVREPKR